MAKKKLSGRDSEKLARAGTKQAMPQIKKFFKEVVKKRKKKK